MRFFCRWIFWKLKFEFHFFHPTILLLLFRKSSESFWVRKKWDQNWKFENWTKSFQICFFSSHALLDIEQSRFCRMHWWVFYYLIWILRDEVVFFEQFIFSTQKFKMWLTTSFWVIALPVNFWYFGIFSLLHLIFCDCPFVIHLIIRFRCLKRFQFK